MGAKHKKSSENTNIAFIYEFLVVFYVLRAKFSKEWIFMERIFTYKNSISLWIVKTKEKYIFCESIGIEKGPLHYWTSTGSQLAINSTRQIKTTLKYIPIW